MLEYATLQNFRLRTLPLREQLPLSAAGKESLYAAGSTPVEIAVRILAVAELCRNGDDPLVHVVGQGYEHVDSPWRDLGVQRGNGRDTAQQGHGDLAGNDRTRHSEVRPRKAAECSVPFTHQKQCQAARPVHPAATLGTTRFCADAGSGRVPESAAWNAVWGPTGAAWTQSGP